jgi:hypothetical protein
MRLVETVLYLLNELRIMLGFWCKFDQELKRVMAHGLLHYCGYGDKEGRANYET